MSEMGIRHFDGLPMTSGLRPDADVVTAGRHVSNVLNPDMARNSAKKKPPEGGSQFKRDGMDLNSALR